ncbi:ComEC/Rec2 family competence protein [Aeromonas veronii]|uniref:ComEC/Rec2 family competence protein n=1 Tax=Aeromonas veronii TaxID=654 RepID=UPI0031FD526F
MKAYFLDVAQGDSTLVITSDQKSILVDCNYSDMEFINKIKSILIDNNLSPDVIDAFFITHPHEDHIKGVGLINEHFSVNAIYESGHRLYVSDDEKPKHYSDMLTLIKKLKIKSRHHQLKAYEEIKIGTAKIKVFSPTKAFLSEERPTERDIHDQCLVFRLEDDSTSIMFTGDSSMESWRDHIVQYYSDVNGKTNILKSDILSASHHGSNTFFFPTAKNSGDPYTKGVEKISPDITIISAGKANRHGHPDQKALAIYKKNSLTEDSVFQTKHLGTIILETSNGSYSIMTEYMQEAINGPTTDAKVEIMSEPQAHPFFPYKLNTEIKFTAKIINKPRDIGDLIYKWTVQNNSIKPIRNHENYEGQKGTSQIYKNKTAYHGTHTLLCEVRTTTGKKICSKHIEVKVSKQ